MAELAVQRAAAEVGTRRTKVPDRHHNVVGSIHRPDYEQRADLLGALGAVDGHVHKRSLGPAGQVRGAQECVGVLRGAI